MSATGAGAAPGERFALSADSRVDLRVDLVIVDLDGTLLDSFEDIRRGLSVALDAVDLEATAEILAMSRRGVPLEAYYGHAAGQDPDHPDQRERFARFVDAYRRHYTAHQEHTRVYPGVVDTLTELRARRPELVLAVGSNKRVDMARSVLCRFELDRYFDVVQGSDEVAKKPDPALLLRCAERAGVAVERAAMVGDTGADVQAARSAGCRAIAVTYGGWTRDELAELEPDGFIDSFAGLLELV